MDFSYDYYSEFSGMNEQQLMEFMEQFGFALIGVFAVIGLIILAVAAVSYILGSIGSYTIAKRRGIHHAWLAWIPVAKLWITGCISDQYQYVVKGSTKNRRKILLILGIANMLLGGTLRGVSNALLFAGGEEAAIAGGALALIGGLISAGVGITLLVFYYMAMYDLYSSCNPQNSVLLLVLSIIFQVTEPFFVFFNRKRDDGMPPRRENPQPALYVDPVYEEPVYQASTEPQEPSEGPEML
ncbi:MAG: hypothetical protein IKJ99_05430 [Oscillospiraceae bacterium]|nr:hypothetical protein [Oscillospiraceae bacterium]